MWGKFYLIYTSRLAVSYFSYSTSIPWFVMEPRKTRSSINFACLHIFHICLSIGLIVAVVHNQLVNNARLENLELKCDCKGYNGISLQEERTGRTNASKNRQSKTINVDLSSMKYRPIAKREALVPVDASNTEHQEPVTNTSKHHVVAKRTSESQDPSLDLRGKAKTNRNETLKEKLQNTTEETVIKTFQEMPDLISCWDHLKKVIELYIKAKAVQNETKAIQKDGCGASQAELNKNPEAKGERGEKGCAGTSFGPPIFHRSLKKFVFKEGESHVLSCKATGNPAVEITWYRDDNVIRRPRGNTLHHYNIETQDITPTSSVRAQTVCPSEQPHPVTQSRLMIRKLNRSDTGTYTCKATNFMGTFSYDIHVLVQEFISYTTIPSNTTVIEGKSFRLRCRASGVPAPIITWYRKDGGQMPSYYRFSNGDLHVHNITKEEEGTFTCLATNVLGSKTTEATVTVYIYPKFIFPIAKQLTINESGNLILMCNATGFPLPSVYWSKVNGSISATQNSYSSQKLSISNMQYKDRGIYVCNAINSVGKITSKVQVNVQVAPNIIHQPSKTEYGFRGKTKVLVFKAFANPAPIITWRKPFYQESSGGRFREENGSLVIESVQYTDSGLYQAVARNILGEVTIKTFLVVRDSVPAAIRSRYLQPVVSLIEGRNFSNTCSAVGIPKPQITWKLNNTLLASTTSFSLNLIITNASKSHSGRYTCLASNEFGFERQRFELKIISKWITVEMYNRWGNIQRNYYSRYNYRRTGPSSGQLMSQTSKFYDANSRKKWKLTSNTRIQIQFLRFSTEKCCDKLKIYDGNSTSSPLLGEFSGESLPTTITSSSHSLYVTFTSDGSKQMAGFVALYSGVV